MQEKKPMSRTTYILMGLLCLVPIAAFAAIYLLSLPVSPVVLFALALACPIAHLLFLNLIRPDKVPAGRVNPTATPRR